MWLQQSSAIQLSSHPAAGLYQLQQPQKLPLPHNSACSIQRVPEHQVGNQQQMEWCVTWRGSKERWAVRQGAKRTMGERGEGAESRVAALGADVEIPRELWVSPWLSCSPPPPPFFLFCDQCPNGANLAAHVFYEVACLLCPTISSISPRLNFNKLYYPLRKKPVWHRWYFKRICFCVNCSVLNININSVPSLL